MNIMRKIVGHSRAGTDSMSAAPSQDNSLGLMHLRKLFSELKQPTAGQGQGHSQKELENSLYNMLPLFCKVFGTSSSGDMMEKFPDVLQFCSHVSRLMVSEIRRRASNQSTDAASCAIVKFLEIESTEEQSSGWMLLSTINLLSSVGTDSLVDCMTVSSLPSTLVKCLYLFFDLPNVKEADSLEPGCEFTPRERRVLLQKVFVQVLVRLCSYSSPAEELARKDDLALLFSAITSWCPAHNVPWRKSAAEVLMTLSRHGLTPNVVQYIHNKGCVALCIDNMQRVQELSPIELVEMFVTVFCFLKDSSEVSQMLLDDFRTCNGYLFLSEFLLKMEKLESEESIQALRNLVLLIGSLCTCGFIELKPGSKTGSLFQMPGFVVPQPSGKGLSVRNLQAFQVLQTIFLKASSSQLCSTILDVLSSIYHQENSNYFILEPQNTLSQFAEKIHMKHPDIQVKFFEIIEFIVFNLNFVPCKELISLSILIKTNQCLQCSILCMRTLMKLLQHHVMYKDVFREVGLLEVMVTCLHRYAALFKEPQNGQETDADSVPEQEQTMGFLVMESLLTLLSGNNSNAGVFRECGGARCAHNMVPYKLCRSQALSIVQQLILCNGGDDDMGTLLGLMHTAATNALELKIHIIKSLLHVLKESHRSRTVFRKVGGFVYVMSVLVSMEGTLAEPTKFPWTTVSRQEVLTLVKLMFSTLSVAMRFEPANARFFATEVRYGSLTEAIRFLGCFGNETDIQPSQSVIEPLDQQSSLFYNLFVNVHSDPPIPDDLPQMLVSALLLLRYLYDMALDNFDRGPVMSADLNGSQSPNLKRVSSVMDAASNNPNELVPMSNIQKRGSTGSLSLLLTPAQPEPLIVHPGAVISMLHLIPAISSSNARMVIDLQYQMCEMIKSLVRTERNQQVMCEAGLLHELLCRTTITLCDESHILHSSLQYIFERLSAQSLTPKDLRNFLRLGYPLCSAAEDEDLYDTKRLVEVSQTGSTFATAIDKQPTTELIRKSDSHVASKNRYGGGMVPLTRVKCLVSMTTPRDVRLHGAAITPSFVEFNMLSEGFGCLYLPSIAPQGPGTPSVVTAGMIGSSDQPVISGIGSGERVFPPASGLTYSSWICIDKFSSLIMDPHPVRLLTIVRNVHGRDENLICLNVFLSARDRSLFISTQEIPFPSMANGELEQDPPLSDTTVRFYCPELTQEGQWHHLVIIFHKAGILKNSSVSLCIDGTLVNTQKLHYFSPYVSTNTSTSAMTVYAYIGTPPQLRKLSHLLWRQGPSYLIEDVVPPNMVQFIFRLGPNYVGSLQAPVTDLMESISAVVAEDKIVFGVHAHAMSLMTIAKIRKVFNKMDAKNIAKQLGMSAHENATPIRILHNSAGHLSGPARSFGAILMGYLGVRTFCPKPVAKVIMSVGGTSALLGLIVMATDVEGLYAAVKALVCVVRCNKEAAREMDRAKGYLTLAMIFKKKRHLLNSHILHLTFSLVGTLDSGRESSMIPHRAAFESLLGDLEIWHEAPFDLQKSLYEHFYDLLTESCEHKWNKSLMQELGLVSRLVNVMTDTSISRSTLHTIAGVLSVLLTGPPYHARSLLRFGQFVASLIPTASTNEKSFSISHSTSISLNKRPSPNANDLFDTSGSTAVFNIKLRNVCLEILQRLISTSASTAQQHGVNMQFCEEFHRVLGFDWLLLFMQGHLHEMTVVLATSCLLRMLQHPVLLQRFREGGNWGGWLSETECILQNRIGVLLGFNVGTSSSKPVNREINQDVCNLPGFLVLNWLLSQHASVSELYFLLIMMLLGQPVKELPKDIEFHLDSVWTLIFEVQEGKPFPLNKLTSKLDFCLEAAVVILSLVRAAFNLQCDGELEVWAKDFPVTVMQFLLYLYHNQPEFVPLCMSGDFLSALASTLFPSRIASETNSEIMSPADDFRPFPNSDQMVFVTLNEKSGSLTSHPARKFVIDFLRRIIMDSLNLPQSNKSASVIDIALEVSPEHSTRYERKQYQTELLNVVMDHLLAADVLLGEQGALSMSTGGNYLQLSNNVFYLAGRVVDKLWQGAYTRDPNEVFEFISLLISQAKRKASGMSLDGIYKSLNRTILYQLSRPLNSVLDQTNVLDALHKLMTNRGLILGPGNYDQEFIGCLCYCLLQIADLNPNNISSPPGLRTTTWHTENESEDEMYDRQLMNVENMEGLQNLAMGAKRVWEELFVCKKPAIEEIFKVTLNAVGDSNSSKKLSTPDLISIRPQIQDVAAKVWMTYYENERKCVYNQSERIQSQLQMKLQKVGQGVMRLAARKSKKDIQTKTIYTTFQEWSSGTCIHLSIVRDLVDVQNKQYVQSQNHMVEYLMEDWLQIENELMRERGLWGPPVGSDLDKWTLDMTEGPYRMRKKMIKNTMFYVHYPFKPDVESNRELKYKVAISLDSKKYYERYRSYSLVDGEQLIPREDDSAQDTNDSQSLGDATVDEILNASKSADMALIGMPSLLKNLPKQKPNQDNEDEIQDADADLASLAAETGNDVVTGNFQPDSQTDNQTILRLLEEGEMITHMFRCARIQGLDTFEGLLLFVKEHFYIIDGFTLLKTKEIADIDSLPANLHDPIIPRTTKCTGTKRMSFKMAFEDMREVHKRRYLLQPIAIEVFSADGRNFLLAFPRKVRNKIFARFLAVGTALTDSAHESVSGQRQNAKVEPGTGLISTLIGEKSVTQRWERGEISNFEYLMCLNTLAGRSYNDLMQYPVFPWIVADYDSEELDLMEPATFRDLSAPMGAQTPDRLKQFKKRYNDWDDPHGETPPYHYGTHYSSAMIVASYLVRMEPFTQTFLRLQGGHFDLADRMFHSVKDAWLSASKHNMADVKELIPEFFYLPEFLLNSNNFDLGAKQSGVSLGDIVLPPWAKGDTREFIRAHREALESDYVSSKLNEWIDLIFGFKQQCPAAIEAVNVFHHLFYEGNVDIYAIDDPLKKTATIGFINNFGQIPKQLFKKPHPQKRLSIRNLSSMPMGTFINYSSDRLFFHNLDNLSPAMQPIKELKGPVGQIMHNDRTVLAVEQNKTLIPPLYNKYLAWGFPDMSIRTGNYDSDKATSVFENVDCGDILCAACPNDKTLVTAGTSTVVKVWKFGKGKDKNRLTLKKALFGHTEPVTCLAVSSAYNVIVSGSRDKTCIIWDLNELTFVRQLRGHAAPVAAVYINDLTGDVATCSGTYLHMWTINGMEIANINTATGRNQQILCVSMSQLKEWDINNVILTGNSDGVVRMWSLEFVEVLDESAKKSITDLSQISFGTPQHTPAAVDSSKLQDGKGSEKLFEKSLALGSSADSTDGSIRLRGWLAKDKRSKVRWKDDSGSRSTWEESEHGFPYDCRQSETFSIDDDPNDDSLDTGIDAASTVRPVSQLIDLSKDLSPTQDFCFVTEQECKDACSGMVPGDRSMKRHLRDGFHWQKQLVFRSKLTMHTAFERKDNKDPAAITALAISKDHKSVYVGDAKGHVYSWSVVDQPGRGAADHWIKDDGGDSCLDCGTKFSFADRRHHCRNCGQLFCSRCSSFETEIRRLRITKPVRVCRSCFQSLQLQSAGDVVKISSSNSSMSNPVA